MIQAPTPAQFLTQAEPDEADPLDPLESIAETLRILAEVSRAGMLPTAEVALGAFTDGSEGRLGEARDRALEAERQLADAHQYLDDAEAKARDAFELIEEVEALIKPSTSKLANSVRAAIVAWRGTPEPEPAAEAPVEDPTADEAGWPEETEQLPGQPAPEAGLEEWRAFALHRGVPDAMSLNRSQIRTALGLPHFES